MKECWQSTVRLLTLLIVIAVSIFVVVYLSKSDISINEQSQTVNVAVGSVPDSERIDINSATVDQLMLIDGVGKVTAQKIVENRPYNSTAEVIEIEGIGEQTALKIIRHTYVNGGENETIE